MFEVLLLLYLGVSFAIRLAQYLLTCLSPYRAFRNINTSFNKHLEKAPFVSIHLPVCNEPPEVIIETIKSLLQIDYNHYEIIVLDNNTSDESLWKPVERFCGDKEGIRFFHVPKLEGNKAGALNRCIKHMDAQSEYILVVDADYIVKPEILDVCVNIAEDQKTDLLQFPQSYRNTSRTSTLNLEYSSYFKVFMNMANWLRCVLSTGTLSFIRCGTLVQPHRFTVLLTDGTVLPFTASDLRHSHSRRSDAAHLEPALHQKLLQRAEQQLCLHLK